MQNQEQPPQQPPRSAKDGTIGITRVPDGFVIVCVHDGVEQTIRVGEYNAWRIFASLSFMLGIKLPTKLVKMIKL